MIALRASLSRGSRTLLTLLTSKAGPDLTKDLIGLLRSNDTDAVALLSRMYPAGVKPRKCVFCDQMFISGAAATCKVICNVDDWIK